jgi:hypothetical protein
MLIDYLTLNYMFDYFWFIIWLCYQFLIHVCLKLILGMLVCNWPHSDWTKSLVCKDTFSQGFHYSEVLHMILHCFYKSRFRFPVSRPDDVSSRPDAHLSTVPAVRTPDRPSIIRSDDVDFRPNPSLNRETFVPACIGPDDSTACPYDVQWSISFRFSFKVQIREDWFNLPDDVDSRPDELIHKARTTIQIQQSGR